MVIICLIDSSEASVSTLTVFDVTSTVTLESGSCCSIPSLTLPALKRQGFLDLRPALNLRVQMAISKPKSRQD
ncbi:hypothetical protein [Moorena sp. SIO3H5]|uniref:hypothetical protein n=1 Tax=Moorena sp. SIO3H5 TaxID=2607834 RepID=UPI0025F8E259|nr:hypothetical protein [Moorena sp. SIO3H5]